MEHATKTRPSNGEEPIARHCHCNDGEGDDDEEESRMKSGLLAGAAMLMLSAGSAFAANPGPTTTDPATAFGQVPSIPYGTGGYVFPDDGAPSGDLGSVVEPQQPPPPNGPISHVYLYPPAQDGGAD
jgi:hypothetical protein